MFSHFVNVENATHDVLFFVIETVKMSDCVITSVLNMNIHPFLKPLVSPDAENTTKTWVVLPSPGAVRFHQPKRAACLADPSVAVLGTVAAVANVCSTCLSPPPLLGSL